MDKKKIKCVVWDLDNTIWDGILAENKEVALKSDIKGIIKELDRRGILQSVSSRNDFKSAWSQLEVFGLSQYFIYPQINWGSKSEAVEKIAKDINIGIDTLAFIDDQEFELEEVKYTHPEVMVIHAEHINEILDYEEMNPVFVTEDSKKRRLLYQNDIVRNSIEKDFTGTKEEFLRTLGMVLKIEEAQEEDLKRVEELTVRTHQLNSTGYVYSYNELRNFIASEDYEVLVVQLDDKYGEYGKIGLALIEKKLDIWEIKLLLMSCRVMARGVGNVLLNYIINKARKEKVQIRAQFVPTDRNKIMYVTYKFNGFKEIDKNDTVIYFEADMSYDRQIPDYVQLVEV